MLAIRIAVLAAALSAGGPAVAASLAIGSICLSGVDQRLEPGSGTPTAGKWQTYRYTFESGGDTGRIAIFDRPIPVGDVPETCQQTAARMRALGARVLVEGRLTALRLRANQYSDDGANRLHIAPKALVARFRSSGSGLSVGGGTVQLSNTRVEVTNPEVVVTDASGSRGEIRISANTSRVAGVRFAVRGGLVLVSDLRARGDLDLSTNLADGVTRFRRGRLTGRPGRTARADFDLGVLAGRDAVLDADEIAVDAEDGRLALRLTGLRGDAASLSVPDSKLAWSLGQTRLAGGTVEATGFHAVAGIEVAEATIGTLEATTQAGRLLAGGGELVRGDLRARFEAITADGIDVSSRWSAVKSSPLAPIFSDDGVEGLDLALSGERSRPRLSGRIAATRVQTGEAQFTLAGLSLPIAANLVTDQIVIPVRIDIPAASGTVKFSTAEHVALLTGRIHRFQLSGDIIIPLPDVAATRLLVGPEGLRAGFGGAIALSPLVAGTKPNFVNADIAVTNDKEFSVGASSKGELLVMPTAMVLAEPVFKFGPKGSVQPVRLDLSAEGGATFRYALRNGELLLVRMRARASNVDVRLLDPNASIDVGGMAIAQPRLQIASIELAVDRDAPADNRAELNDLVAAASTIRSGAPGEAPGGLAYGGALSEPVQVRKVRAATVKLDKVLVIEDFVVEGLSLALGDGWAELGDGMRLTDVRLALRAESVAEQGPERKKTVAGGHLRLDGRWAAASSMFSTNGEIPVEMSLGFAGPQDALSGTGSFQVNAFTANARTAMVVNLSRVGFRCANGEHLRVPFRYDFAVPTVTIGLKLENGKLSGTGESAPFALAGHAPDGGSTCESKRQPVVTIPRKEGWTWGVCVKRWRVKKCKWKWSTPALGFSYNFRLAVRLTGFAATMTKPRYRLTNGTKLDVCNEGPLLVAIPGTWGGISPQIDLDGIPMGSAVTWMVNAGLSISFEAAQSLVLSSAGETLAWLASVGGSTWNVGTTPFSGKGTCLGVSG